MLLDITINKDSLSIDIENPFRLDVGATCAEIGQFAAGKGADVGGLDIAGLLPRMIRGVAGCEDGCPSNAKSFVQAGFANFSLEYIEGGILKAEAAAAGGAQVTIKMFPDF